LNSPDVDQARLASEARRLLEGFKTLLMATVSADGVPEASYAPFVRLDDHCFYVYVSGLSRHTRNLEASGLASVLFIEDERETNQPFARKRLSFDCRTELLARESDEWQKVMDLFSERFGDVVGLIRPLTDFRLFRLRPESGVYVKGFAQAYRVSSAELGRFEHIRDATQSDDKS
jgi:heme iron utilization protein